MADKSKSGDQTEKATPKRLRDARKKGDVAKSKDLTSTLVLAAWLALGALIWRFIFTSFNEVFASALASVGNPSPYAMRAVGAAAANAFVKVSLALLLPIAILGTLAEFAQVGPIATTEKMKPKLDHMNPAEGLKRMFSVDNLVEVAKSLAKVLVLVLVVWVVISLQFRGLAALPMGGAGGAFAAMGWMLFQLAAAAVVTFVLVAGADIAYQRFSFAKKMRMSRREIRQEHKENEGDPMLKGRRKQLHQEWAARNVVEAARGATALVMNPTHIAVALAYDPQEHPAPVVTAKGMGPLALEMRSAAEAEGVPVIRNVAVARALNARAVLDDIVPKDMFSAVAEVIVFARRMREEAQAKAAAEAQEADADAPAEAVA